MKTFVWMLAWGSFALLAQGCNQSEVTETDVESARDEYREELHDAHETLTEGQKEVAEEMKEAQKAQAELQHTEKQFNQTQTRDRWLKQQQEEINALRERVAQLPAPQEQAELQSQFEEHVDSITDELDEAETGLDTVRSADLDSWETKKPEVTAHLEQAKQEMQLLQAAN